jgi:hypothetical protein
MKKIFLTGITALLLFACNNDRINQQFSDYMRGVDRYSDGESQIQLPSGYSSAWVNDKGEYILTDTEGWNPGTEFMGNWKQLEKSNYNDLIMLTST